jgi:hypothetical protein
LAGEAQGDLTVRTAFGLVLLVLIPAALFTVPLTFLLLRQYRGHVLRLMARRVRPTGDSSQTLPAQSASPAVAAPELVYFTDGPGSGSVAASDLYLRMRRLSRRAAAVYIAGGVAFASVMAAGQAAVGLLQGVPWSLVLPYLRALPTVVWLSYLLSLLSSVMLFAFPAVLMMNLVAAIDRRSKYTATAVYLALYVILGLFFMLISPSEERWGMFRFWAANNLVPTLLTSGLMYRGLQGIGPMVYAFTMFVGFVAVLVPSGWEVFSKVRGVQGVCCTVPVILLPVAIGAGLLAAVRWLYQRKLVSENSLLVDSVWLIFAFVYALVVGVDAYGPVLALASFVLFKSVTGLGFALSARPSRESKGRSAPQLLFLRVFALGKRSEQLYTALSNAWRYVGSIRLIIGPDLATSTVQPHNFLDFVSGRLERQFIDSADALERRVAEMDSVPDPDGRFRVNDFFCYQDTWRMVLSRLASDNVVALLDLRQFSVRNTGCVYEIEELLNRVPLERILFVVDRTTDDAFLGQIIRQAWTKMAPDSPNRQTQCPQLRLFCHVAKRSGDYDSLLRALAASGGS